MTLPMLANDATSAATLRPRTGNWLLETWGLARWTLFLAWRRAMSKVLLGLLLAAYAIVAGFEVLIFFSIANSSGPGADETAQQFRDAVTFPTSLTTSSGLIRGLGVLFVCILIGAVIGGEYSFGTHRLSLSRGMTRAQVLAGQVLSCAVLALVVAAGMLLIGALLGITLGPALGSDLLIPDLPGAGELALYWLALAFNLFGYMLIALFFATLGRSAVAGIGGSVALILVELVVSSILNVFAAGFLASDQPQRAVGILRLLIWFPGNSFGAVITAVGAGPIRLESDSLGVAARSALGFAPAGPLQALLIALGYCVVLIGGSYLLFRLRDVTD